MFVNSDFSELLSLFNDNGVRYLVVGGYAVVQHAEPRFTKDLHLWIATDPGNAASVFRVLQQFGAPLAGLTESDFAEAWPRRQAFEFDDLCVWFISRRDLSGSRRPTRAS